MVLPLLLFSAWFSCVVAPCQRHKWAASPLGSVQTHRSRRTENHLRQLGIDLLPWLPVAHVLALCICCLCILETCGYTNVVNGTQSCGGSVPWSMKELFACVVYPVGNKLAKIDDEFGVWPKQRCWGIPVCRGFSWTAAWKCYGKCGVSQPAWLSHRISICLSLV